MRSLWFFLPLALQLMADACVTPNGIDDGLQGSVNYDAELTLPEGDIFGAAIQTGLGVSPGLFAYETPIQLRNIQAAATGIYGAAAAFHATALEIFGRKTLSDARRRCQPTSVTDSALFAKHRSLTLAYTIIWSMETFIPEWKEPLRALGSSWGMDLEKCPSVEKSACTISSPWGLARSIVDDAVEIYKNDGWNADGSLSSPHNRIPFKDWRTTPYEPNPDCKTCWQPLEETNGIGFLFKQEHVVPHIGQTGRSYFLGDTDICSRTLNNPNYNLDGEAKRALTRTALLDDELKAEIEFFDSKLTSLVPLQVQYYARLGINTDSFEFIQADMAAIGALYEAILVVWKEKVRFDLVRPTTYIHSNLMGQTFDSYQGPSDQTVGPIRAEDWQPYIRVMPHAEYPSGSSCMCVAFSQTLEAITGSDSVLSALGGPLAVTVPALSSKVEAGKPLNDIVFTYDTWSNITERCGVSRLNGGMHFTASVANGETLCEAVGTNVASYFKSLEGGATPKQALGEKVLTPYKQESRCSVLSKSIGS